MTSMVSVTILVINSSGLINTLLQREVEHNSSAYVQLQRKYKINPDSKSTIYDRIKTKYDADKRHKIVWIETPIKN